MRESERDAERREEEEIHPTAPEECPGLARARQLAQSNEA